MPLAPAAGARSDCFSRLKKLRIFNAHIDPHPAAEGQLEQLEVMMDQADRFNAANHCDGRLQHAIKAEVH